MAIGDVRDTVSNNNLPWNERLALELDAADGKRDGKINYDIWNGFLKKIGSRGNKISVFINLKNAAKSFNYYSNKKDNGIVNWENWEELLTDYQKDLGLVSYSSKPKPPAASSQELKEEDLSTKKEHTSVDENTSKMQAEALDDKTTENSTNPTLQDNKSNERPKYDLESELNTYIEVKGYVLNKNVNGRKTYMDKKKNKLFVTEYANGNREVATELKSGQKVDLRIINLDGYILQESSFTYEDKGKKEIEIRKIYQEDGSFKELTFINGEQIVPEE